MHATSLFFAPWFKTVIPKFNYYFDRLIPDYALDKIGKRNFNK